MAGPEWRRRARPRWPLADSTNGSWRGPGGDTIVSISLRRPAVHILTQRPILARIIHDRRTHHGHGNDARPTIIRVGHHAAARHDRTSWSCDPGQVGCRAWCRRSPEPGPPGDPDDRPIGAWDFVRHRFQSAIGGFDARLTAAQVPAARRRPVRGAGRARRAHHHQQGPPFLAASARPRPPERTGVSDSQSVPVGIRRVGGAAWSMPPRWMSPSSTPASARVPTRAWAAS